MEEKKDEALIVIAKERLPEGKPRVEDPEEPEQVVDITLVRSKKYIKSLMNGDAFEGMKMIGDQMAALLLGMNDQMLRWLEVLNDPKTDKRGRGEASFHINMLMQAVSQMADARIKLQAATGFDKLAQAGMAKPQLHEKGKDLSPEEFLEKYKDLVPQGSKIKPDSKPAN